MDGDQRLKKQVWDQGFGMFKCHISLKIGSEKKLFLLKVAFQKMFFSSATLDTLLSFVPRSLERKPPPQNTSAAAGWPVCDVSKDSKRTREEKDPVLGSSASPVLLYISIYRGS